MSWLDLLKPQNASEHPFLFLGIVVGLLLWMVGFSRRKILQDLEILDRLEKLDPNHQARPAIKAAIASWVIFTYAWPLVGSIACLIVGSLLLYTSLQLAGFAWKASSSAIATMAVMGVLGSAVLFFLAVLQMRRMKEGHFASLLRWNPNPASQDPPEAGPVERADD